MLVAAVVGVARGVQWVVSDLGSSTTAPAADPHGKPIRIVVPTGADASEIGAILEEQGVVDDGGRFREYAKDAGEGSQFKAGTYAIKAGITTRDPRTTRIRTVCSTNCPLPAASAARRLPALRF